MIKGHTFQLFFGLDIVYDLLTLGQVKLRGRVN